MDFFVIGKNLPHTLSPQIHNYFGIPDYGVKLFENGEECRQFIGSRNFKGFNVTIPYKQTVMPFLDEIDAEAKEVGSVNTVVNVGGKIKGYNTDVGGMAYALNRAGIELKGKSVLILGSGGTAKTAQYLSKREGAREVNIVSRTGEINYDNCYHLADVEVIINATPVGMMPKAYVTPVDIKKFGRLEGVFDCVYNPLQTMLVTKAKETGISASCGLYMLAEQARLSHNMFADAADIGICSKDITPIIVSKLQKNCHNIVLTGMAGSGKTTIGRKVAELLDRRFYDTDEIIQQKTGKLPEEIILNDGEEAFRKIETLIVAEVCANLGAVIATGGGAVISNQNRFFIKSNGINFLIVRPIAELETAGRPLSSDISKARALFESRRESYYSAADIIVKNDDIDMAANKIIKEFESYSFNA